MALGGPIFKVCGQPVVQGLTASLGCRGASAEASRTAHGDDLYDAVANGEPPAEQQAGKLDIDAACEALAKADLRRGGLPERGDIQGDDATLDKPVEAGVVVVPGEGVEAAGVCDHGLPGRGDGEARRQFSSHAPAAISRSFNSSALRYPSRIEAGSGDDVRSE